MYLYRTPHRIHECILPARSEGSRPDSTRALRPRRRAAGGTFTRLRSRTRTAGRKNALMSPPTPWPGGDREGGGAGPPLPARGWGWGGGFQARGPEPPAPDLAGRAASSSRARPRRRSSPACATGGTPSTPLRCPHTLHYIIVYTSALYFILYAYKCICRFVD